LSSKVTLAPLVSIITPTYNHEKFIEECILSVLSQEYTSWEMIIVDDGSTDATGEIVKRYATGHENIYYYRQENVGILRLAETYNFALNLSKGKYIAILEGDDTWKPKKLKIQTEAFLSNSEAVLCWGRAEGFFNNKVVEFFPKHLTPLNKGNYFNTPLLSILDVLVKDFPTPLTWLIAKKALLEIGGFSQTHTMPAVDLNTILQLSKKGPFIFLDEILGSWRQFPAQITKSKTVGIMEASEKIILDFYQQLDPALKNTIDINDIYKTLGKKKIIAFSRAGRFALIRKEYSQARHYYLQSITNNGSFAFTWKLRSLIGYIFSWLKLDIERLAHLLGKKSYLSK
jgi:glycosyltransferase involved in cell wall biosynthesis